MKKKYSNNKKELEAARTMESKLRKFIELMNLKSEKGVIAAANYIKQPQSNTIAEIQEIRPHATDVPNREIIAEKSNGNMSNFFAKPIAIPQQRQGGQVPQRQRGQVLQQRQRGQVPQQQRGQQIQMPQQQMEQEEIEEIEEISSNSVKSNNISQNYLDLF